MTISCDADGTAVGKGVRVRAGALEAESLLAGDDNWGVHGDRREDADAGRVAMTS